MRIKVSLSETGEIKMVFHSDESYPIYIRPEKFPELKPNENEVMEYELVPIRKQTRIEKRWIIRNHLGTEYVWKHKPEATESAAVYGPFDVEIGGSEPFILEGWWSKGDVLSGPWPGNIEGRIHGKFIETDPSDKNE